jgi:hypothetical protein
MVRADSDSSPGLYTDGVWRRASFYWLEKTLALARADTEGRESEHARRAEAIVDVANLGTLADTLDGIESGMSELRLQLAQRDERIRQLDHVIAAQQRDARQGAAGASARVLSVGCQTDDVVSGRWRSSAPLSDQAQLAAPAAMMQIAGLQAKVKLLQDQLETALDERQHAEHALSKMLLLSNSISAALELQEEAKAKHGGQQEAMARPQGWHQGLGSIQDSPPQPSGHSAAPDSAAGEPPNAAEARHGEGARQQGEGASHLELSGEHHQAQRTDTVAEQQRAEEALQNLFSVDKLVKTRVAEQAREIERRSHVRMQTLALKVRELERRNAELEGRATHATHRGTAAAARHEPAPTERTSAPQGQGPLWHPLTPPVVHVPMPYHQGDLGGELSGRSTSPQAIVLLPAYQHAWARGAMRPGAGPGAGPGPMPVAVPGPSPGPGGRGTY